jgi:phenol 2-monooxygenase
LADQQERHATAQQLIDFDYKWSRMFSGKADGQSVSPEAWKKAWDQSIKFTSGTGVVYKPNLLITDTQKNADKLAKSVIVGSVSNRGTGWKSSVAYHRSVLAL